MNEHDLLDAIGKTEETVLEASEKRHIPWKFLLTAAACLLVILSMAFSLISPFLYNKPLPGQIISTERLTWLRRSNILTSGSNANALISATHAPHFQFFFQKSVEARVLDVLPGKYQFPSGHTNSQKYRILRMELLDAIYANGMPSEFYYLLPEELSTNLKQFDSLIMTVSQVGIENAIMRNADRSRLESFSFLFSSGYYDPHTGAVIACKEGKIDTSLYTLKGWNGDSGWAESLSVPEGWTAYLGTTSHTVPEIKAAILQGVAKYLQKGDFTAYDTVFTNADLDWPEVQAVVEYVKPFENGYYNGSHDSQNSISYGRYINGFDTNEYISINLENKAIQHNNIFTEEDIKNLPNMDLPLLFARWTEAPKPRSDKEAPYKFCGVKGSYEKNGEHVFGIVQIYWGYPDIEESPWYSCCVIRKVQEYSYLLVYPNGKTVPAKNLTELDQLIAEYTG